MTLHRDLQQGHVGGIHAGQTTGLSERSRLKCRQHFGGFATKPRDSCEVEVTGNRGMFGASLALDLSIGSGDE